jgi:fibronectin type 3 domain-containing protein
MQSLRFSVAVLIAMGLASCAENESSQVASVDDGGAATSEQVTLAWDAPSVSDDEMSLQDLAGYRVYDGSSPGDYSMVTDVGTVTQFTTESLAAGTYYFAVTAYDTSGNESTLSSEVAATVRNEDLAIASLR